MTADITFDTSEDRDPLPEPGDLVRITSGPLKDSTGEFLGVAPYGYPYDFLVALDDVSVSLAPPHNCNSVEIIDD
jgi:hypothetical protein